MVSFTGYLVGRWVRSVGPSVGGGSTAKSAVQATAVSSPPAPTLVSREDTARSLGHDPFRIIVHEMSWDELRQDLNWTALQTLCLGIKLGSCWELLEHCAA